MSVKSDKEEYDPFNPSDSDNEDNKKLVVNDLESFEEEKINESKIETVEEIIKVKTDEPVVKDPVVEQNTLVVVVGEPVTETVDVIKINENKIEKLASPIPSKSLSPSLKKLSKSPSRTKSKSSNSSISKHRSRSKSKERKKDRNHHSSSIKRSPSYDRQRSKSSNNKSTSKRSRSRSHTHSYKHKKRSKSRSRSKSISNSYKNTTNIKSNKKDRRSRSNSINKNDSKTLKSSKKHHDVVQNNDKSVSSNNNVPTSATKVTNEPENIKKLSNTSIDVNKNKEISKRSNLIQIKTLDDSLKNNRLKENNSNKSTKSITDYLIEEMFNEEKQIKVDVDNIKLPDFENKIKSNKNDENYVLTKSINQFIDNKLNKVEVLPDDNSTTKISCLNIVSKDISFASTSSLASISGIVDNKIKSDDDDEPYDPEAEYKELDERLNEYNKKSGGKLNNSLNDSMTGKQQQQVNKINWSFWIFC
jgi:hypothetical protein